MVRTICLVVVIAAYGGASAQVGEPSQLTFDDVSAGHAAWSPDGSQVAFESERSGNKDIWIVSALGGDPVQVTSDPGNDCQPDWSPDGESLVFYSDRSDDDNDIWIYHLPSSTLTRLTTYDGIDWSPKWSPDGSSIAFVSDRAGSLDIWTIPSTGGVAVRITDDPSTEWGPAWSPDGSRIAFIGFMSGNNDIWTINSDGSGEAHQVTTYAGHDLLSSWSPDGTTLVFASDREGTLDLWTIPDSGGAATQITSGASDDGNPDWSPDGSRIAFESNRDGTFDVWILPLEQFSRVYVTTDEAVQGKTALGAAWIDFDNDNDLDLHVVNMGTGLLSSNDLFVNAGDGQFTRFAGDPIVDDEEDSRSAAWADFNNDGSLDVYVTNFGWSSNSLYINNGDGSGFVKETAGAPVTDAFSSFNAGWSDYDRDGDLDLYVVNENDLVPPPGGAVNHLYRNDGPTFEKITAGSVVTDTHASQSLVWCDYDDDGDGDLFVTNSTGQNNDLYRNDGAGSFAGITDQIVTTDGGASFSPSFADFDNDGDMDLFVTTGWGSTDGRDCLYANNGDGSFSKVISGPPVEDSTEAYCGVAADYDNDGDLDLLVVSRPYMRLYENLGGLTFNSLTDGLVVSDSGRWYAGAWGDVDMDGDLDLFVTDPSNGPGALYLNNGSHNHWITLRLTGTVSNTSAIGARVTVKAAIGGSPVLQRREIGTNSGGFSQSSLFAHFGLSDATIVDSIWVEWPSGIITVLTDVEVDQFLEITESCCGRYTGGYTGNANCSDDGKLTLSDISRLIDRLYVSKQLLCCEANGNTNGSADGEITLSDVSRLIDNIYISKQETALCGQDAGT